MTSVINFVKEAIEELKKVQWPSKKEAMRLTVYVIILSAGVGLFVSVIDYLFTNLLKLLIA